MNIKRISLFILVIMLTCIRPYSADAQVQIQGPRNAEDVYSGVVYGPIDPTDTLWRIASRYKQEGNFSVYQTMLAIYELNPQAFENQNFNTMVNGAILQLPSDRYIARMNIQRAKAKAEADDRAFGRPNSVQPTNEAGQIPSENLKPEVPLVNQEDLSNTQRQLQNQLNALNRQQNTQFGAIKDQVSSSIDSVQALLDENRRLYDRIDQVNTDIADLRNKVEGEVQGQIDEQLALQKELIALVKDAQQRQLEKESESIITKLTSSTGIILLTTGFTLIVLIGLAIWALRKPGAPSVAPVEAKSKAKESNDIVDDELVIGEIDDAASAEADELMAALEAELPDDDVDDILGEQLEDGLDEIQVDDDVDDFGDLDDEMLVPNATSKDAESSDSDSSGTEEVSFDADAISLDDEELGNESIDLSDDDEILDTSSETSTDSTDLEELDLGDDLDDETDESSGRDVSVENAEEKQGESIADSELELDGLPSDEDDATPDGVNLNEDGEIDENTIEQIEQQIQQKDEEINQLTDDILADLDSAPEEDEIDETASEQESAADTEFDALTDIDDILENTEVDEDNTSSTASDEEAQKTPELQQAQELEKDKVEVTDLADEILADIDSVLDEDAGKTPETEEINGPDPDDILADLGVDANGDDGKSDPIEEDNVNAETSDETSDAPADLADELINELSEDEEASDELDNLLDEFASQEDDASVAQGVDDEASTDANEDAIDLDADEPIDLMDSLADELLGELTEDEGSKDELDELLEEMGADKTIDDSENDDLIDELLEDIPSFTAEPDEPQVEDENTDVDELQSESQLDKNTGDSDVLKVDADNTATSDDSDDSLEAKDKNNGASDDDDLLADLPGLDDWLDEDNEVAIDNAKDASDDVVEKSTENDDLSTIEESDFDSILADIEDKSEVESSQEPVNTNKQNDLTGSHADNVASDIEAAGLDLDALMSEGAESRSGNNDIEDFVDVDDLLSESESAQPISDKDLALDLESSLDRLIDSELDSDEVSHKSTLVDQSSNLDLAQVYIDMEDYDAARELLAEVSISDDNELKTEAKELLDKIEGK